MLRPTRLSYQTNKHVMEELKDLDQIMIQEVGLDVTVKCILWVKAIRIRTIVLDPGQFTAGQRKALHDRA